MSEILENGRVGDNALRTLKEQREEFHKNYQLPLVSPEDFIKKPSAKFIEWYNEQNKLSVNGTAYKGIYLWLNNGWCFMSGLPYRHLKISTTVDGKLA